MPSHKGHSGLQTEAPHKHPLDTKNYRANGEKAPGPFLIKPNSCICSSCVTWLWKQNSWLAVIRDDGRGPTGYEFATLARLLGVVDSIYVGPVSSYERLLKLNRRVLLIESKAGETWLNYAKPFMGHETGTVAA